MRAVAEYRQHAKQCRELAAEMSKPEHKKVMEELAQAWESAAALREHDLILLREADGDDLDGRP